MKYSRHWQDFRMASLIKSGGRQCLPPLHGAAQKYIHRIISVHRLIFITPSVVLAVLVTHSDGPRQVVFTIASLLSVVIYLFYEFVIRPQWEPEPRPEPDTVQEPEVSDGP
jgi:hypothetical protein